MLAYRSKGLGISVKGVIGRQPALIMNFETKPEWEGKRRSLEENADAPMINKDFIVSLQRHAVVQVLTRCLRLDQD